MKDDTLEKLVRLAKDGDTEAFRELFDTLSDRLFRYAASHVGDREAALDIVQDTFVELWGALKRFEWQSNEAFYGFVFVILKRLLARHYEKKRKESTQLPAEAHFLVEVEDYRHLLKCMDSLSAEYREVLTLRYWSDLTFNEIASILHIKETTAKVWHHRAIQKLRSVVHKHEYAA